MAARFCPQCGHEVSSSARFCPNCAAPLTGEAASTVPPAGAASLEAPTRLDTAAGGARRLLLPILVLALIALVIAVATLARPQRPVVAVEPPPATAAPPLTAAPSAPAPAAPPLTAAPSAPAPTAPPLTAAPSAPAPALPPDVAAYLTFLQGIEERRVALTQDTSGAMGMLQTAHQMQGDQGDPEQHNNSVAGSQSKISQGYSDYNLKWQVLIHDFNTTPAPTACVGLANAYLSFVNHYASSISKLQTALLNGDLGAAMGVQGAQAQINSEAVRADDELGRLCARYSVPKPFSIQSEGGSSSLISP